MIDFLVWWIVLSVLGIAALPVCTWLLSRLPGQGYAFSKILGLLLVSYLLWIGALSGAITNDLGGVLLALLGVAALSARVLFAGGWQAGLERAGRFWTRQRANILAVEVLFLLAFAGWALVRAYAPDKILPSGGEKYMEIAFLNGVLNSPRFPPLDPWLAGYGISYYYFGYVMMGAMTRLSGSLPTVAFDLYDALTFGLTAAGAYGVVSEMAAAAGARGGPARSAGLLGALFVPALGNLQGLVEGLYSSRALPEAFWAWLDIPGLLGSAQNGSFYPGNGWWWWRASRVLSDLDLFYQPVVYQPIDEFPFFSFLLGDNHPHKLALPFVLLCVGLALHLMLKTSRQAETDRPADRNDTFPLTKPFWGGVFAWARAGQKYAAFFLLCALVLGSLGFLNTWDMPIYLALFVLAYLAGKYARGRALDFELLGRGLLLGAGTAAAAVLLYVFFYVGFSSQAGGILPYIFPPTRLAQYFVMFGPFLFILAFFLPLACRQARFPWRRLLAAWLWISAGIYALYLLVLLAGLLIVRSGGAQTLAVLQPWLGDLTLTQAVLKSLEARLANPWMYLLVSTLMALTVTAFFGRQAAATESGDEAPVEDRSPTRFALLLAFLGLALTLSVEFVYLRDLFGLRMNTVFKFYYQGWVLLACASAYGLWWVLRAASGLLRGVFLAGSLVLVGAGLAYPLMAVYSRAGAFAQPPVLDAAASLAGRIPGHWAAHPEDWAAIQWINETIRPSAGEAAPVILEAPGGGYEHNGRVSAFTGLPTLLGWSNHEGQWRGSYEEINRRSPDIQAIYTGASAEQALELLEKWQVRYVVLGEPERQYIHRTCAKPETACSPARALAKFERFLTPVYSEQGVTIYAVP